MAARKIVGLLIVWFPNFWVIKYHCNKELH
jgi:hypothetical protein